MLNKFLEAMDNEREYDFIANHYYEMSREDLKSILLEYMYAVHSCMTDDGVIIEDEIREAVRDELQTKEVFG